MKNIKLIDFVIIFVFLASLLVPLVMWVGQKDQSYSDAEKRKLQPFPTISLQESITDFTRQFDGYFQDHFGLREWFIHRYQREVGKRFGISGVPNIIEGRDGWMYLSGGSLLSDLKGRLQFTNTEKAAFWKKLAAREKWLKGRGIAYIFMVAPNKQSICPEYLPSYYQGTGASRLENLLVARPKHEKADILDVRKALRRGKEKNRLYHKSDTHWNSRGAAIAYRALMKRTEELFPDFHDWKEIHFSPVWKDARGGDLALMLGKLDTTVEKQPVVESASFAAVSKLPPKQLQPLLTLPQLRPYHTSRSGRPLRVLVLHDSFFNAIKPFVSESYGEVFCIWRYYDDATMKFFNGGRLEELVELYKPDLVIEELVERNLDRFLPTTPQE